MDQVSLSHIIGLAFMMMLFIEGLVYALFPEQMKRMMLMVLSMPVERIRSFAFGMVAVGAIGMWFYLQV